MATKSTLEEAIAYRNPDVIYRFLKLYDIPRGEAEELFVETLKYMWLTSNVEGIAVYPEMLMLDEMWHNFILFTKSYRDYCEQYLGRYVDHLPASEAEDSEWERGFRDDKDATQARYLEAYGAQLEATEEHLGEDTVRRWHVDYRNRYDGDFFARCRRPAAALQRIAPESLGM